MTTLSVETQTRTTQCHVTYMTRQRSGDVVVVVLHRSVWLHTDQQDLKRQNLALWTPSTEPMIADAPVCDDKSWKQRRSSRDMLLLHDDDDDDHSS